MKTENMLGTLNQDVMICVCNSIYIGTITFATEKYITIQAIELKTSKTIATKFYRNELTFIQLLKQYGTPAAVVEPISDFTLHELKRMSKMLSNIIYIQRFDRNYNTAIADIAAESFIGFFMAGVECGRFADSSIIAISTSTNIYVFDIQLLGRIEKQTKKILEANVPKKICHDASRCADHLKHQHNINLSGVFDTMVADCMFGFDKQRSSLDECLRDHFNIPGKFLDQETEPWHARPLTTNQKNIAAQKVVFLQKLHCKQMQIALEWHRGA